MRRSAVLPTAPRIVTRVVAVYAIAAGAVTLAGWFLNVRRLTDWADDGISMFVNAAICSLLCGVALLLADDSGPTWRRRLGRGLAAMTAVIGGLTLWEHLLGLDFGIDTLLFARDWGQEAATSAMRMGPPASTSFLVLGIALYLTTCSPAARGWASYLAPLPVAVASLSLIGYWYRASQLFGMLGAARFTGIAWQTSTLLAALGIGVMAAVPEHGLAAALRRNDSGGALLRRLVVPIIVVPLVLGWLRIAGEQAAVFDAPFGTALENLVEVLFFLLLILWTSQAVGRLASKARVVEGRLAAIVESSDDAIISKSLDGTIRSWNSGAERIFGYTAEEAVGKNIMLLIPSDRVDEEKMILSRLGRGEPTEHFETVRVRKDGTKIDISLTSSPIRDAAGKIIGASKIAHDITEEKRAVEVIRRSENELHTLANSIPQLAWIANPDGHIFWYNHRWFEYTGTTLDQMQGWGWQSVHDPEILPAVVAHWKRSLATGEPFEMEFPLRRHDGVFRWFLTRVHALRDEQERVVRWFGTNTDIDDVKQTEQVLREQTETLESLNEAIRVVGSTLDLNQLVQSVTDIATKLSDAKFGAFFYNTTDDNGDAYLLYTLSGAPVEAFEKLGKPRATALFGTTFRGEGIIRSDNILQDPRYGQFEPHFGMPEGHLPVRSYLAVPVVSRTGEVIGGLFFGHPEVGVFSERTERILGAIAHQAAIGIDNSRLYENLKKASEERKRLLVAERGAGRR